jgi:hypothetical protein
MNVLQKALHQLLTKNNNIVHREIVKKLIPDRSRDISTGGFVKKAVKVHHAAYIRGWHEHE